MGRLFWKFFVCILLAQLTAIVGLGGAVWLRNHNQEANQPKDLDTSPPAEMAINSAAATLEYGGVKALRRLLENMERHRVFAVDKQGHELLGRAVTPSMLRESHALLKQEGKRRVVRQVAGPEGKRFILFLPSHGMDLDRPLMAGLGGAQMALQGGPPTPHGQGPGFGPAPGPPPVPGTQPGQAYAQSPGADFRLDPSRAGAPPDAPPNGR
ncbi:two-component sensor histidine kinase, partial [Rugamonas sp. FT81W]|nr:two-component sensor histidine kinase [Duganella vulcania]